MNEQQFIAGAGAGRARWGRCRVQRAEVEARSSKGRGHVTRSLGLAFALAFIGWSCAGAHPGTDAGTSQDADASSVSQRDAAARLEVVGDAGFLPGCLSGCPVGEHCDVVLTKCAGSTFRSVLASSGCTRPICAGDCFKEACASNDDCSADLICGATGVADRCDEPCCLPWGRCAMSPACPADCTAIVPPHAYCFACVCPSCEPADAG